jgi:hypothetical protein
MVLLGDGAQVEACFGPFGDSAILDEVHGLRQTFHTQQLIWTHEMVILGDEAQGEARLVTFRVVLILTQDRCTVCAERTIGSEIILDAPGGTTR